MTARSYSYLKDPYLSRMPARVLEVGEADGRRFALLDDTIFYPEGGGQPADRGRIGHAEVVDVQKVDGEIRHYIDGEIDGEGGGGNGRVELAVDWHRRFDHMQQHSAQHVLTAVADELFGWNTTSFHLGSEVCDIELDTPSVGDEELARLEEAVARIIREDRTITVREMEPAVLEAAGVRSRGLPEGHRGAVRVIDINGVDECACGGTHLRSTCELEALKLLGTESIRGGTRLFWVAGRRVLRRLQEHETRNRRLREILGAADHELPDVAALKVEQQKEARKRVQALEQRWAEATAEALAGRPGPWVDAHFEDTGAGPLRHIAQGVIRSSPGLAIFLTAEDDKGAYFAVAAGPESSVDAGEAGRAVAEILGGRGGGKGAFFQGRAESLDRRAEALGAVQRPERATE